MGFWEYFGHILSLAFSRAYNYATIGALIISIIVGIVIWKRPRYENKIKVLYWLIPLVILIASIFIGFVPAAYSTYTEKQNEVENLEKTITSLQNDLATEREQHRPMLTYEVKEGAAALWEQEVGISANYTVKNIGDRIAYQVFLRRYLANLNTPHDIYAAPDSYGTNPIYPGQHIDYHLIRWSETYTGEDVVSILEYTYIRYSNAPSGGNWYEQPFWLAHEIYVKEGITRTKWALPEEIAKFEPFVIAEDAERK